MYNTTAVINFDLFMNDSVGNHTGSHEEAFPNVYRVFSTGFSAGVLKLWISRLSFCCWISAKSPLSFK